MTRGGVRKEKDGPERRCIATGRSGPVDMLIRFVAGPDGELVPDLAERLPGRGVWATADADLLTKAVDKGLFNRALKQKVSAPANLPQMLEGLIARRLIDAVAFARKAGLAVAGFEKTRARLRQGPVAALIEARDGSEQGKAKLRPLAQGASVMSCLDATDLGLAFGRESVIHACLDEGGVTNRVMREARRLSGFRLGCVSVSGRHMDVEDVD